jgi:anthranilate phosphoribosyltransferase
LPTAAVDAVAGGDAAANAELVLAVLNGEQGARRDMAIINGAAAIYVSGIADDMAQGFERAAKSIDSGAAWAAVEALAAASSEAAR